MYRKAICGVALAVVLAACGEAPTAPAAPAAGARFDGGMMYGEGLAVAPDAPGDACEGERGGMTYGGGLYAPPPCPEPAP